MRQKFLQTFLLYSPIILILIVFVLSSFCSENIQIIGKIVDDFRLQNTNGKIVSLKDYPEAKGFIIVFTCNHCPFAKLYTNRLNDLQTKYQALNVPLLAINSMDTLVYEEESFKTMQERAKSNKYKFPYLQDAQQTVSKNFAADHTPQAFIIWKENKDWTIQYSGAIDDNGQEAQNANPFLAHALNELLAGKKVTNSITNSIGCRIFYRK